MGNNFKVKCLDNRGGRDIYTVGKIYEFKDGYMINDNRCKFPMTMDIKSFEDWTNWVITSKWELVDEPKEDVKMNGNFKVKCVSNNGNNERCYTVGKIYEIKDGKLTTDNEVKIPQFTNINTFEEWQDFSGSTWELYKEPKLITGESIAIRRKKSKVIAVLSIDGEFKYSQYIKLVDANGDFKTAVKMVVERLMDKWDGGKVDLTAEVLNWDIFNQGKVAIHCDTEEKSRAFMDECDEHGIKWMGGRKASEWVQIHGFSKDRCYNLNNLRGITVANVKFYEREGFEIIEYAKLIIPTIATPSPTGVSRQAEVGEYVKITNGDRHKAKVGEIYKVESHRMGFVEVKTENSMQLLKHNQYVIVENPIKKVKRPAKVGEWVEILRVDNFTEDDHKVGDIFQTIECTIGNSDNGAYYENKEDGCGYVDLGDYLVLENYTPDATPEVVAPSKFVKAKAGDKIKIVNDKNFHEPSLIIGDIQTVENISCMGDGIITDKNVLLDKEEEYIIIEETPNKPIEPIIKNAVKTVKVGDKIKIVKYLNCHSPNTKLGDIHTVTACLNNRIETDKGNIFYDEKSEYEIIKETINPLSAYTQEQLMKELFNRQGL